MSDLTMTGEELWTLALPLLKDRVGQATFDAVLRGAAPLEYDGASFTISVPNDFVRRMLEERHRPVIAACLQEVLSAPDAYKLAVSIEPHIIIPMHYGDDAAGKAALKVFLKEGEGGEEMEKLTLKKKDLEGKEGDIIVLSSSSS